MHSKLINPEVIGDLLLQRISRMLAVGTAPVIRMCEGQLGITRREWRVMASLQPNCSMLSSELAAHTQLDRARTSRAISSLVAKGLLDRQIVPSDQRKATIRLTVKGSAMYASFFPVVTAHNVRLLKNLSSEELSMLDKALSAIQIEAEEAVRDDGLPKANRRRSGHRD